MNESLAWQEFESIPKKRKPDRIKKADIPLNVAIYKVRQEIIKRGKKPSAEHWTFEEQSRDFIKKRVGEIDPQLAEVSVDKMIGVYLQIRKSKKRRLLIEVAELYGWTCFYLHSSNTICNEEVSLERLKPGKRGGEYEKGNVRVACMHHNRERATKQLEDFVGSI